MNWRSIYLRRLSLRLLLLGAGAGAWAAFLAELAMAAARFAEGHWFPDYVPIAVMGLAVGALVAPIDEVVHRFWGRVWRTALLGGAVGLASGITSFVILSSLLGIFAELPPAVEPAPLTAIQWFWFFLPFAFLAAGAGLASGLALRDPRMALRRAGWGLAAGGPAGFVAAAVYLGFPHAPWLHVVALSVWGAFVAWALFWSEKRFARHWLRVLIGPEEDRVHPMERRLIRIGKLESNDIPLPDSQEIYPYHCEIRWAGDHFEIVDDEQGGMVLVNFRQVQEQALKSGDLLKIGSVLLQYGEGSQR